jgi:uncharacterized membrane protein YbhN (UPF0104 family)
VSQRFRSLVAFARRHRRLTAALQVALGLIFIAALVLAVHKQWANAADRLRDADLVQFALALVALAAYYLVFVLGWIWILSSWGIRITYATALRSEMVSMLAKYVPGGVWTPAARIVALRRAGVTDGALVFASMMLEAGLSALAGVLVFVVSLAWVHGVDVPVWPLLVFGLACAVALHPPIFRRIATKTLRRFGVHELPEIPEAQVLGLLVFYAFTWLIGGAALWFLLRSVGGDPTVGSIAFLGGTSAVGAIVAVLFIFAPSGLGPREASMYALMIAIVPNSVALGATVLNRIAITIVEIALLVVGGLLLRGHQAHAEVRGLVESEQQGS